jgi:hypothetical protein
MVVLLVCMTRFGAISSLPISTRGLHKKRAIERNFREPRSPSRSITSTDISVHFHFSLRFHRRPCPLPKRSSSPPRPCRPTRSSRAHRANPPPRLRRSHRPTRPPRSPYMTSNLAPRSTRSSLQIVSRTVSAWCPVGKVRVEACSSVRRTRRCCVSGHGRR